MDKLINATSDTGKANLLRICWESAIDFSEYLDVFVDMLINEDFITALEASTVIENLGGKIPEEKLLAAIKRLETNKDEDKSFLLEDTILHLKVLLCPEEEEEYEEENDHHHCGCDGHHHDA